MGVFERFRNWLLEMPEEDTVVTETRKEIEDPPKPESCGKDDCGCEQ